MKLSPEGYIARVITLGMPADQLNKVVQLENIHTYAAINAWIRLRYGLNVSVNYCIGGHQYVVSFKKREEGTTSSYYLDYDKCWLAGLSWAMDVIEARFKTPA